MSHDDMPAAGAITIKPAQRKLQADEIQRTETGGRVAFIEGEGMVWIADGESEDDRPARILR
jgi:hypothetical protein